MCLTQFKLCILLMFVRVSESQAVRAPPLAARSRASLAPPANGAGGNHSKPAVKDVAGREKPANRQ